MVKEWTWRTWWSIEISWRVEMIIVLSASAGLRPARTCLLKWNGRRRRLRRRQRLILFACRNEISKFDSRQLVNKTSIRKRAIQIKVQISARTLSKHNVYMWNYHPKLHTHTNDAQKTTWSHVSRIGSTWRPEKNTRQNWTSLWFFLISSENKAEQGSVGKNMAKSESKPLVNNWRPNKSYGL